MTRARAAQDMQYKFGRSFRDAGIFTNLIFVISKAAFKTHTKKWICRENYKGINNLKLNHHRPMEVPIGDFSASFPHTVFTANEVRNFT